MNTTEVIAPLSSSVGGSQTSVPANRHPGFPSDAEIEALLPNMELVESDGETMESDLYRLNRELLLATIACHFNGRNNYYAGGNSFIYYSQDQARHREFKGPDFYLIKGVSHEPIRPYWAVWNEGGRYPDVIIELLSPTTRKADFTTKKDVYEKTFRTGNYFCFDPKTKELFGWKRQFAGYADLKPIPNGRLWCDELNLWLGVWEGEFYGFHQSWLRFFTPEGQVVPVPAEIADAAEHQIHLARYEAEAANRRAEAAEAELAQLKALLNEQGKTTK